MKTLRNIIIAALLVVIALRVASRAAGSMRRDLPCLAADLLGWELPAIVRSARPVESRRARRLLWAVARPSHFPQERLAAGKRD